MTASLKDYLTEQEDFYQHFSKLDSKTNGNCELFDLAFVIGAGTYEKPHEATAWLNLKRDLAAPNETFDRKDKDDLCYRIDREKTLANMEKYFAELDSKMPDNHASLLVMEGLIPQTSEKLAEKAVGLVHLVQLKAKDNSQIEKTKSELVERLKEVDGPCLSLDTPDIFGQAIDLWCDASDLINKYGDILKIPNWRTRFFRLDC